MSDQIEIPPGTPLSITLTFMQWRALLGQLGEQPFNRVGPLIGEIERQAQIELRRIVPMLRANGEARPDAS